MTTNRSCPTALVFLSIVFLNIVFLNIVFLNIRVSSWLASLDSCSSSTLDAAHLFSYHLLHLFQKLSTPRLLAVPLESRNPAVGEVVRAYRAVLSAAVVQLGGPGG